MHRYGDRQTVVCESFGKVIVIILNGQCVFGAEPHEVIGVQVSGKTRFVVETLHIPCYVFQKRVAEFVSVYAVYVFEVVEVIAVNAEFFIGIFCYPVVYAVIKAGEIEYARKRIDFTVDGFRRIFAFARNGFDGVFFRLFFGIHMLVGEFYKTLRGFVFGVEHRVADTQAYVKRKVLLQTTARYCGFYA